MARPKYATVSRMEYLFLIVGVLIGVVLGVIVVAIAAIGSYERGYRAARAHRPA